jgi:hypothetical protein
MSTHRTTVALLLSALAACGSDRVVGPSADLSGVWEYSFSTRAAQACGAPAPPGLVPGCGGGGEVTLTQSGAQLGGTIVIRAGCQSCGMAADSFGGSPLSVTGTLNGDKLEFEIWGCHDTARVAAGEVSELSGDVTCDFEERTQGTWRMTRRP